MTEIDIKQLTKEQKKQLAADLAAEKQAGKKTNERLI